MNASARAIVARGSPSAVICASTRSRSCSAGLIAGGASSITKLTSAERAAAIGATQPPKLEPCSPIARASGPARTSRT
jgi:hypothetical protein